MAVVAFEGDSFTVFTKTTEARQKEHWNNFNLIYITHEKGHASAPGNALISRFNLGDSPLSFVPTAGGCGDGFCVGLYPAAGGKQAGRVREKQGKRR
ncbi:MAG: hypothetical protein R6V25_15040 [Desulfatiglandales bacterium]